MSLKGILKSLFRGEAKMLKVGDKAPQFDAVDHNGNRVRLNELRGSKVVLWFFPKADTPG